MKSSGAVPRTPRILLDTSFLLPTLGIGVTGATQEGIRVLSGTRIPLYYSRFSILESLWVATRTIHDKTFDDESLAPGLKSIMESGRYTRVEEDTEIFIEALQLRRLGHKDMIDNILYASARRLGLRLLTLDDELKKFIAENKRADVFLSVLELATLAQMLREEKAISQSGPGISDSR